MADFNIVKLEIPSLFKKTDLGSAIPELTPGCEWAKEERSIITMKLDGIAVRVGWDNEKVAWTLTQMHSNGMMDLPLSRGYVEDKYIWQAFDAQTVKQTGLFICYGADINNNPHNMLRTAFIKLAPISPALLVTKGQTTIKRGPTYSVKEFYDSIRAELVESPDLEGLVFHLEDFHLNTVQHCKVKRQDFGLPWPVKADPIKDIKMLESNGYGYGV